MDELKARLAEAEALVITAGAGMGVDSGLPDFRGNEGFWKAYPPYRDLGYEFVQMACPDRFVDDPQIGWGFYGHRLNLYRETRPHAGFSRLREFAKSLSKGCFVFTSNVDGHFQRAGFVEDVVHECHGSLVHWQCFRGCGTGIWPVPENLRVAIDERTMRAQRPLPECPMCGGLARPNVLMFGDWGWDGARSDDQEARYRQWLSERTDARLVILEFGAGTAVPTVRMESERLAHLGNATLVRVNPREPGIPDSVREGFGLPMGALEATEKLLPS